MKKRVEKANLLRRELFQEAKDEIAAKNIRMVKHTSFLAGLLIILFIWLTPYLVTGWEAKIQYILFVPAMWLFFLLAVIMGRQKKRNYYLTQTVVLAFCIVTLAFIIAIDVFAYPDLTSTYMPVVLLVVPLLFIMPLKIVFPLVTIADVLYIIFVFLVKEPRVQTSDAFSSIVSLFFVYAVDTIIMQMQAENLYEKMKFKLMSSMDQLTGICNKKSCEQNIINFLETKSEEDPFGLLILDIDDFKRINDEFGHQTGDRVLTGVGKVLREVFHPDDIIGRIGGDEFMVLFKNAESIDHFTYKCTQILEEVQNILENTDRAITCSIGVAMPETEDMNFKDLYNMADRALYKAKANGKNSYIVM